MSRFLRCFVRENASDVGELSVPASANSGDVTEPTKEAP